MWAILEGAPFVDSVLQQLRRTCVILDDLDESLKVGDQGGDQGGDWGDWGDWGVEGAPCALPQLVLASISPPTSPITRSNLLHYSILKIKTANDACSNVSSNLSSSNLSSSNS